MSMAHRLSEPLTTPSSQYFKANEDLLMSSDVSDQASRCQSRLKLHKVLGFGCAGNKALFTLGANQPLFSSSPIALVYWLRCLSVLEVLVGLILLIMPSIAMGYVGMAPTTDNVLTCRLTGAVTLTMATGTLSVESDRFDVNCMLLDMRTILGVFSSIAVIAQMAEELDSTLLFGLLMIFSLLTITNLILRYHLHAAERKKLRERVE